MPVIDATGILQTVAADERLRRHGFVLVTALARMLPDDLSRLTRLLRVPVVAKPFTAQELLAAVAAAEQRHHVASGDLPPAP